MGNFDPRAYIKEIARGPHASRSLSREQTRELFAAVFAGDVADIALGAILAAFRMKGETVDEIAGMMDALAPHVLGLRLPARRALPLVLPSYNGARKLPNLVPLLAALLAREGVPVLVHGVAQEPGRVSSFQVLQFMGYPAARTLGEAERALEERHLAAMPLTLLSPALARVVEARARMGVRNSGHTLAKLLLPGGVAADAACRLISVTHPNFMALTREYFAVAPGDALLMRGVEGEPVVRLHAPQPIEEMRGALEPAEHAMGEGEADYALPPREAGATAQWTRDVLEGKLAVPAAIAAQAAFLIDHCRKAAASGRPSLRLVSSH